MNEKKKGGKYRFILFINLFSYGKSNRTKRRLNIY